MYGITYYLKVQVADKKYTVNSTIQPIVVLVNLRINPFMLNAGKAN
jgi:hypothetical protein